MPFPTFAAQDAIEQSACVSLQKALCFHIAKGFNLTMPMLYSFRLELKA
jgi:hypothetical protein